LSGTQLDGVVPTYQYDPSRYQVRVAIEAVALADPDRARNALLMEDSEAGMAAQQIVDEEPEARCTPARRALLALAGRSESPAWEAAPQQGPALRTPASSPRQSASTAASGLAAASPNPAIIGGAGSPEPTVSANGRRNQPTAIKNAGLSTRPAVSSSSRPAATTSAGAAGKQAPAATVASRAPKVEVPVRMVRMANPSRSSGAGAVRDASGANAADIVARVRSEVNRTLSALQGGAFRLR
jgi:hypothetical protein